MIAKLLYNLGIYLYQMAIGIAAPFNPKAKLWVDGRKDWRNKLKGQKGKLAGRPVVWVHCASLGEFEQGRPIIEAIKSQHPGYAVALTFFSPSGYEVRKGYEQADIVSYLPADTKANARDFINILEPNVALFVKYEFWLNYLETLKKSGIDTYVISAVFKEHHPFFKWYGGIFRKALGAFKTVFVQDEHSVQLLKRIGINNAAVCGDTRFDRVIEIKDKFRPLPEIAAFKGTSKLIVAGSTWPKDEDMVLWAYDKMKRQNTKLIIVPHDIEAGLLRSTREKLEGHGLSYSLYTEGINNDAQVLVLDTIGMLSRLYYYAEITYIGGGFNGGLHNCLEAAVYGKPVAFFGKDFVKYNEAVELVHMGAAVHVSDKEGLLKAWQQLINDAARLQEISKKEEQYFRQNARATQKVLDAISLQ